MTTKIQTLYIASTPDSIKFKDKIIIKLNKNPEFKIIDIGAQKSYTNEYNITHFDSPSIATKLSQTIKFGDLAIIICGTGGINSALNRHYNIIAERPNDIEQTKRFVESSNINTLVLSSLFYKNMPMNFEIIKTFVTSKFKPTESRIKRYKQITDPNYGKDSIKFKDKIINWWKQRQISR